MTFTARVSPNQLQKAGEAVRRAEEALDEKRTARDMLIVRALEEGGWPVGKIASLTGMTVGRVSQISSARKES